MYVIKARTHGCVQKDSEMHPTGVTGLQSSNTVSCVSLTFRTHPCVLAIKPCDNLNYQSGGFETLQDLTTRRLIGYWNRALVLWYIRWCHGTLNTFHITSPIWGEPSSLRNSPHIGLLKWSSDVSFVVSLNNLLNSQVRSFMQTKSISYLLIPWLQSSPGHKQKCH